MNRFLQKELVNAQEVINKLQEKGQLDYLSIKEIRNKIVGRKHYHSFFKYGKELELQNVLEPPNPIKIF